MLESVIAKYASKTKEVVSCSNVADKYKSKINIWQPTITTCLAVPGLRQEQNVCVYVPHYLLTINLNLFPKTLVKIEPRKNYNSRLKLVSDKKK